MPACRMPACHAGFAKNDWRSCQLSLPCLGVFSLQVCTADSKAKACSTVCMGRGRGTCLCSSHHHITTCPQYTFTHTCPPHMPFSRALLTCPPHMPSSHVLLTCPHHMPSCLQTTLGRSADSWASSPWASWPTPGALQDTNTYTAGRSGQAHNTHTRRVGQARHTTHIHGG